MLPDSALRPVRQKLVLAGLRDCRLEETKASSSPAWQKGLGFRACASIPGLQYRSSAQQPAAWAVLGSKTLKLKP